MRQGLEKYAVLTEVRPRTSPSRISRVSSGQHVVAGLFLQNAGRTLGVDARPLHLRFVYSVFTCIVPFIS